MSKKRAFKLRPDQRTAANAASRELRKTERATVVMPPGAGKTFVSYTIDRWLKNDTTIVFCPNVGLVYQAIVSWQQYGLNAEVFAFTAGTMSKQDKDSMAAMTDKSVINTTSGPDLKKALRGPSKKVVFATYQSAPNLILAKISADLLIFDEAHHLTGAKNRGWSKLLDNKRIRGKRLFVTATPKVLRYRNASTIDMDDVKAFGERVYSMSIAEATKKKILVPVQIVLVDIDKRKRSKLDDDHILVAATKKAIKQFNLNKGLSFHNKVVNAERFAQLANSYDRKMNVFCLSAINSADERRDVLDEINKRNGLVANVRLFGEGFDYTALDYVVLTEPRYSMIDVTQIVGRAMRRHKGKKIATVVLPISAQNVDKEKKFNRTLNIIWQILTSSESIAYGCVVPTQRDLADEFFKKRMRIVGNQKLQTKILKQVQKHIRLRVMRWSTASQKLAALEAFTKKHKRPPRPQDMPQFRLYKWYGYYARLRARGEIIPSLSHSESARFDKVLTTYGFHAKGKTKVAESVKWLEQYVANEGHLPAYDDVSPSVRYVLDKYVAGEKDYIGNDLMKRLDMAYEYPTWHAYRVAATAKRNAAKKMAKMEAISKRRKVKIDGVVYSSTKEAAEALGVQVGVIQHWKRIGIPSKSQRAASISNGKIQKARRNQILVINNVSYKTQLEAATKLGLDVSTVYMWVKSGKAVYVDKAA